MSSPPVEPTGQSGRYQRSASGLVAALVIVMVVVAAYIGFRALVRADPVLDTRSIDDAEYAQVLGFAREGDFPVVAPPETPEGWVATVVRYTPGPSPRFSMSFLTEEERYVGLEQTRGGLERLVETYVDEEAEPGPSVEVAGELGGTWQSWTDEGGDYALTREYEGTNVLVVGSAGPDVVRELAASLTE
ncbi:MAG: DUF4245 domain-containing protein [Nocardioides sp.]|nr:DUF4245 domain-containing protein [Nocardioides sp.]